MAITKWSFEAQKEALVNAIDPVGVGFVDSRYLSTVT
jgi:hypothetical protein